MSHIQRPLTLPKHSKLLNEINKTIIDIKVQDDDKPLMVDKETLISLRETHKAHSLQDICELLRRCYTAINEQMEDPRRY
jgi:hypothetical protein